MPSALLLLRIFRIWGTFTSIEPAMIPIPSPLLSVDLKHGTEMNSCRLCTVYDGRSRFLEKNTGKLPSRKL